MILATLKNKLFECGFNVIDFRMFGGKTIICIVAYREVKNNNKLIFKMSCIGELDQFNGVLSTCLGGTIITQHDLLFLDIKEKEQELRRKHPKHF